MLALGKGSNRLEKKWQQVTKKPCRLVLLNCSRAVARCQLFSKNEDGCQGTETETCDLSICQHSSANCPVSRDGERLFLCGYLVVVTDESFIRKAYR